MDNQESRISILENKTQYYDNFLTKVDTAIDRMSEASSRISQMLAVHEERLQHASKTDEMILSLFETNKADTHKKIESIRDFSEEESKGIHTKIEKIQKDISDLQKLKWVVNGIGIAASIAVVAIAGLFQGMMVPQNSSHNSDTHQVQ
jgi:prefoldin subunit 5